MSIIDTVQQNLGPNEIQQISQQIGADPATTQRAVEQALPLMVGGMAGTAQQPGGADSIQSLFGSHGNVLGNLGSLIAAGGAADGGILGSILGRHQDDVHNEVQRTSGLDSAKVRQLLMILAPIVLGALAKRHAQSGVSQGTQQGAQPGGAGVNDVLRQEAEQARQRSPGVGGILGKILSHVEEPRA